MSSITLDPLTTQRLLQSAQPVEVLDSSGSVIGHFIPKSKEYLQPPISREELERRCQETGGRSLKDIWRDLQGRKYSITKPPYPPHMIPEFDEEELRQIEQEGPGRSLKEILTDLENPEGGTP